MNRNFHLDVLKGIAIVMVVLSHCYSILYGSNEYIYSLLSDLGRWGVLIFLLVSGYLVSLKKQQREVTILDNLKHVLKKIKRFYLLHILMLIAMVCIYVHYEQTDLIKLKILSHIFLVQSFIPIKGTTFAYSLNTPTWYLSMMIFCWLLTPWLMKIEKKVKHHLVIFSIIYLILGVLLYANFQFFSQKTSSMQRYFMYVNPLVNCIIYFLGMISIRPFNQFLKNHQISSIFLFCLSVMSYFLKDIFHVDWRVYFLLIPTVCLISSFIELNISVFPQVANIFGFLGENSMIMLLTHFPICYVMRKLYRGYGLSYLLYTMILIFLIFMTVYYLKTRLKKE